MRTSRTLPPTPMFDGTQPCAETDPEAFFADDGVYTAAKRICSTCEWREPCLEYALHVTVEGVWGGTSPRERQAIRRERNIVPVPLVSTFDTDTPSRAALQKRAERAARSNVA